MWVTLPFLHWRWRNGCSEKLDYPLHHTARQRPGFQFWSLLYNMQVTRHERRLQGGRQKEGKFTGQQDKRLLSLFSKLLTGDKSTIFYAGYAQYCLFLLHPTWEELGGSLTEIQQVSLKFICRTTDSNTWDLNPGLWSPCCLLFVYFLKHFILYWGIAN